MPNRKIIEKPDGARNVESWDVHIERSYELERVFVPNKDGTYRIESYYNDSPSIVWLKMAVKFWDDEAARDFEAKVRAMLPEETW